MKASDKKFTVQLGEGQTVEVQMTSEEFKKMEDLAKAYGMTVPQLLSSWSMKP